jgi:hypothetical protein
MDFDWTQLLTQWNNAIFASPLAETLPQNLKDAKWLGATPATDDQLTAAQHKLGIALPPSYRAFLRVSNGWGRATQSVAELWDTCKLNWFRKSHRDWITAYIGPLKYAPPEQIPDADYFSYGSNATMFKPQHFKETLQISGVGDAAVYLLNPQVITKDGEWEAWFLANWSPGVIRYRSFRELMEAEYQRLIGEAWTQPVGVVGDLPDEYIGAPGSTKRRMKKRARPRELKVLGKAVGQWTVEELLGFLSNPDFDIIYGEVILGLYHLGDPRAVEPLLALVQTTAHAAAAARALQKFIPEKIKAIVLERLRTERGPAIDMFARLLAEMGEVLAVPILIEIMKDESEENRWHRESAGRSIAEFGIVGFQALIEELKSDNPNVRRLAADGLSCTRQPETRDVFQSLVEDADPSVREIACLSLGILPKIPKKSF